MVIRRCLTIVFKAWGEEAFTCQYTGLGLQIFEVEAVVPGCEPENLISARALLSSPTVLLVKKAS